LVQRVDDLVRYRPTRLVLIHNPVKRARVVSRRWRQLMGGLLGAVTDYGRDGDRVWHWTAPEHVSAAFTLAETSHPDTGRYFGDEAWKGPGFRAAVRAATRPGWGEDFVRSVEAAYALGGREAADSLLLELLPRWVEDPRFGDPLGDGDGDWV
jgi:hypothetical protein